MAARSDDIYKLTPEQEREIAEIIAVAPPLDYDPGKDPIRQMLSRVKPQASTKPS